MVSPSLKWDPGCSTRVRIPEECVRVTFLLISSSLRPLHPVHFKICLAQILYQEVHILRARNFPRAYTTREKYFFLESAWMCNCCVYILGVFHYLVLRLAMWHSCVFSQQMHGLALFQMTSRVFHTWEYLKSACASHFCWYQVVFVHCILCILKYSYLRFSIKRYIFHALETFLARIPCVKNISF